MVQRLDTVQPNPYPRSEYARRVAWRLAERTLIRPSPPRAFRWRRWLLNRFGARVYGATRPTTRVWHPWLLEVGAWSMLGEGVEVYNLGEVRIGEHTVLSQRVFVCAGTHDHRDPALPLVRSGVTIGRGVWVAAEAFIGPGVTVGDGAVVGARAVVVRDVPANAVVAGNPAVVVGERTLRVGGGGGR